jgi:hypothetical protein
MPWSIVTPISARDRLRLGRKPRDQSKMTDELVRKIHHVLSGKVGTEHKVVYLLVEIRKLMERDNYKDPILKTFCNWVVHTSLEKPAMGSAEILSEFDLLIARLHEPGLSHDGPRHGSLGAFRVALLDLSKRYGLPVTVMSDASKWKRFCRLYCSIVSDCPIVFSASKANLKFVDRVELTRVSQGVLVKSWPLVHWRLTLRDGSTMNWGFHAW